MVDVSRDRESHDGEEGEGGEGRGNCFYFADSCPIRFAHRISILRMIPPLHCCTADIYMKMFIARVDIKYFRGNLCEK